MWHGHKRIISREVIKDAPHCKLLEIRSDDPHFVELILRSFYGGYDLPDWAYCTSVVELPFAYRYNLIGKLLNCIQTIAKQWETVLPLEAIADIFTTARFLSPQDEPDYFLSWGENAFQAVCSSATLINYM